MIRIFFWLLLVLNAALFAFLLWGGALTQESANLQPPLNPEKIKLLGFSPPAPPSAVAAASAPASHAQASAPAASAPASLVQAQPSATCLEWGEFSGADLARADASLAGLNLGPGLIRREVEHSIGYWVYIPPLKNHAAVNEKIARLKKLGIKEFFVVQEKGKWLDAISLNVFKTEDQAKKFLDHLRSVGVKEAVMGERQTRLKFTVFSLKNPTPATLAKLSEWQKGFNGIELKSVACN
jgi:hypothetical protein